MQTQALFQQLNDISRSLSFILFGWLYHIKDDIVFVQLAPDDYQHDLTSSKIIRNNLNSMSTLVIIFIDCQY